MVELANDLTLAVAGDAILTRRVSEFQHERFEEVVEKVRDADASFANLEVLLHDYEGYPKRTRMEPHVRAPPWAADELTWCGFDVVAAATNHSFDYTYGGMEATMLELDDRQIPYAGLGRNLAEARRPAYVDTPAGRVAVVAACSTITPGSIAGERGTDVKGRPGISSLRWQAKYVVPEETYEVLREMSEKLGFEDAKRRMAEMGFPVTGDDGPFQLLVVGQNQNPIIEPGDEFRVRRVPNEHDVASIKRQIKCAERQADWVVSSLHAHEGLEPTPMHHEPAPFVESFAKECVEAGADVFVGHGPHAPRGIEIYDGAPIFYSLGNAFAQIETVTRQPKEMYDQVGLSRDATPAHFYDRMMFDDEGNPAGLLAEKSFWEGILPVVEFEDGELENVRIHPLDLLYGEPRPRRGTPVIAKDELAASIIDDIADRSSRYETEISFEDGVGVVEVE